jgi:hypothetical protein
VHKTLLNRQDAKKTTNKKLTAKAAKHAKKSKKMKLRINADKRRLQNINRERRIAS